ncbi:MAG: hydantoinase/oxoprolinase family protein [Terriglobia bacterium]
MRIAIDTGGTFTDCVYIERGALRVLKLFSTPASPSAAILSALARIGPPATSEIRHGTTVGTNTLLERKGARVAFVTTGGFEDTIAIGRQQRGRLYDWSWSPPAPLAPADLRFGVNERTLSDGTILLETDERKLAALLDAVRRAAPEAIALSLLFSFANPRNERAAAAALRKLGVPVSVSHEIAPEFREYERASTVLVNAYLAPTVGKYLGEVERSVRRTFTGSRLSVMQSSGGIVSAAAAAREPVRTLLSGPAGGVVAAQAVARLSGFTRIISLDMGGTSTDVALAGADETLSTTTQSAIGGLPVAVPMLDIHTVGAGGGSIARFDSGGVLCVGPESAGADPGPICFGRGTEPTVTDANLLLGRVASVLGGEAVLDAGRVRGIFEKARGGVKSAERFAQGIVSVAEAAMSQAIRVISVERGHDPREFTLISFGGAGPMHACALASALGIPRVLVPRFPGALSALGILISDVIRDYSRTLMLPPGSEKLERCFRELERRGRREMQGLDCSCFRSVDMRYRGQGYEINVSAGPRAVKRFHRAHAQRYGYADQTRPVETVTARVRLVSSTGGVTFTKQRVRRGDGRQAIVNEQRTAFDGRAVMAKLYDRALLRPGDRFRGPAIVTEYSATAVVPPQCRVRVDEYGQLMIAVPRSAVPRF